MRLPRLIGMVHLPALPGSPAYRGSLDEVLERAVADARTLTEAGFDAIMIENFGDAPFFPGTVPAATIAAMTRAVHATLADPVARAAYVERARARVEQRFRLSQYVAGVIRTYDRILGAQIRMPDRP